LKVNFGKRVIDRRKSNARARPKATEPKEARLERQVRILADHSALLHMVLLNARAVVEPKDIFATMTYLENASAELLRLELTPAEGLQRKYDQDRGTELYQTIMSSIRFKLRQQYQEDKFQP